MVEFHESLGILQRVVFEAREKNLIAGRLMGV